MRHRHRRCSVPEGVTQGQFFEAMNQLRNHIDQKHASLRLTIEEQAQRLESKLETHAKEDAVWQDRVLVIETERRSGEDRRKEDRDRQDRRVGMISTGITMLLGFAYFVGRIVWEWFSRK